MQTIINETKPTIINDHGDDITNHMTKPMKDDGVLSWQIAVILDDIGKLYECIKDSAQALAKNTTTLKQGLTKEFKLAFDNWFNTLSTDELTSIFGPNALINDISAEDDIYKAQITTAKHILSALKPVFVQPASNKTRINQLIDMIRENKNDQESYDFYKPVIIKLLSGLVEYQMITTVNYVALFNTQSLTHIRRLIQNLQYTLGNINEPVNTDTLLIVKNWRKIIDLPKTTIFAELNEQENETPKFYIGIDGIMYWPCRENAEFITQTKEIHMILKLLQVHKKMFRNTKSIIKYINPVRSITNWYNDNSLLNEDVIDGLLKLFQNRVIHYDTLQNDPQNLKEKISQIIQNWIDNNHAQKLPADKTDALVQKLFNWCVIHANEYIYHIASVLLFFTPQKQLSCSNTQFVKWAVYTSRPLSYHIKNFDFTKIPTIYTIRETNPENTSTLMVKIQLDGSVGEIMIGDPLTVPTSKNMETPLESYIRFMVEGRMTIVTPYDKNPLLSTNIGNNIIQDLKKELQGFENSLYQTWKSINNNLPTICTNIQNCVLDVDAAYYTWMLYYENRGEYIWIRSEYTWLVRILENIYFFLNVFRSLENLLDNIILDSPDQTTLLFVGKCCVQFRHYIKQNNFAISILYFIRQNYYLFISTLPNREVAYFHNQGFCTPQCQDKCNNQKYLLGKAIRECRELLDVFTCCMKHKLYIQPTLLMPKNITNKLQLLKTYIEHFLIMCLQCKSFSLISTFRFSMQKTCSAYYDGYLNYIESLHVTLLYILNILAPTIQDDFRTQEEMDRLISLGQQVYTPWTAEELDLLLSYCEQIYTRWNTNQCIFQYTLSPLEIINYNKTVETQHQISLDNCVVKLYQDFTLKMCPLESFNKDRQWETDTTREPCIKMDFDPEQIVAKFCDLLEKALPEAFFEQGETHHDHGKWEAYNMLFQKIFKEK